MSSYSVVAAVSEALRSLLWEAYNEDDTLRPIVGSEEAIVLKNPTQTAQDSASRISLWLHHITENEFMKNQPMERGPSHDTQRFPPLALNFSFLLTPFAASTAAEHLLLGKAMQVFYDNATILLRDEASGIAEELRIIFSRLTLEELTRVWDSLREPYRLSLCYQVRVNRIDSLRVPRHARIVERFTGFEVRGGGGETS
ncbi:MAG: DUF4255 domain-containing protein [Acidobacteriota bacterium]